MIGRREIPCREIVEIITEYIEGTLSRRDRKRVARHLAGCGACTEYLAQMRRMIRAVGTIREEDIPTGVRAELMEAFRGWNRTR
jgi:anti-sigma factor RsiW